MNTFRHNLASHARGWLALLLSITLLGSAAGPNACAQLAITEVMSNAATNCAGVWISSHPDFWELTNEGTNSIDLTGYRFWDQDPLPFEMMNPLPSTIIAPGESIIFVRTSRSVTNAAGFRAWWGEANLPTNLQVYFYDSPGFDGGGGDAVRLWDANTNLVDAVYFDQAVLDRGITFVTDTNTGQFGVLSQLGVCGAVKAESCDDIGSPGYAPCGPVPMFITQQPVSQTVDAGSSVTFHVQACGLPRPRGYQWYFNGSPVSGVQARPDIIPVVVSYAGCGLAWKTQPPPGDLVIPEVQPSHAGQYFVVLTNGLEAVTSAVVTLTVNTNPTPPQIYCPPTEWWFPLLGGRPQTNLIVFLWQTAIFDVWVRAYPQPTYSWGRSTNGTAFEDLRGATNHSLVIPYVQSSHAGTYRVCVRNTNGTNYAYATLTVKPKPPLRITEAMAYECQSNGCDWWELTNTGDEPVNLTGYMWNDCPATVGGGPTITNAVIIKPGESIILLESQTRESFLQWWGASNLPPNLQFIVYRANGLSETTEGDQITLWNQSPADDGDFVDSVGFSTAVQGASFWFDPEFCLPSEFGLVSQEGDCGVIRAANGCDLGSPGWTRWTPPCLTAITNEGAIVRLWWKAQPGSLNQLQYTTELAIPPSATVWTPLGTYTFPGATGMAADSNPPTDPQRFYRIVRISAADCSCPE